MDGQETEPWSHSSIWIKTMVHLAKKTVKTLDPRSREALFLRYAESSTAYYLWDCELGVWENAIPTNASLHANIFISLPMCYALVNSSAWPLHRSQLRTPPSNVRKISSSHLLPKTIDYFSKLIGQNCKW